MSLSIVIIMNHTLYHDIFVRTFHTVAYKLEETDDAYFLVLFTCTIDLRLASKMHYLC